MIWNDIKLAMWGTAGGITPYNGEFVNPASIDLCLGNKYRVPEIDKWSEIHRIPHSGVTLNPNEFILLHTFETVRIPTDATAFLYLKSTMGRRGLEHLHAGYVDPGFHGQLTLEIVNHWPYPQKIYAYTPFVQLVIASLNNTVLRSYADRGHYQNQTGPTPQWR
jgi:dCTP deaminase